MNKEKKKEILLKNFDIIKNNFGKFHTEMGDCVVNMFTVDVDMAVEMWKYLLIKYKDELMGDDSYSITECITYEGGDIISKETMYNIILSTPEIKQAIFSDSKRFNDCDAIIVNNIISNEIELANELLDLQYNNSTKREMWFQVMNWCLVILNDYTSSISEEAFDLLDMWCSKVEDEEERAALITKLVGFV